MKRMTLSVVVGMTALMILACYWGTASAQTNAGIAAIGVATPGPFSLVKHGGGFHGGFGFGGWAARLRLLLWVGLLWIIRIMELVQPESNLCLEWIRMEVLQ